jgi:hypothetical protein
MMSLNRILVPIILGATISLLFAPSLASAEIKVSPPPNWQPAPTNNSTLMQWFQNSTKSSFEITKAPLNYVKRAPQNIKLPFLSYAAPLFAERLADFGLLESTDQISFGNNNYGYRYFYFINLSSFSEILNSSNLVNKSDYLLEFTRKYEVPYKGMLILTQKQDDLYAIEFRSPKEKFDSILNEIKPTLDSIQFTNSTATNQTLLESR